MFIFHVEMFCINNVPFFENEINVSTKLCNNNVLHEIIFNHISLTYLRMQNFKLL